jgi:hydroxyethylthiazole kinase
MSLPLHAAALLDRVRQNRPLVHNITNYVAMDITANALLALGASPAMIHAMEEAGEFAAIADAVVINIGTLSTPWVAAMEQAAARARDLGKPWVLDPVGAGATRFRTDTARRLIALRPTVVRGNATEILALAEGIAGKRGVDASHGTNEARGAALDLARRSGCIVAMTGAVDLVTDGERVQEIGNGHPLMTRVTAVGCTASALVGAFLAVEPKDAVTAATAALTVLGIAGERAAEDTAGPGSFRVNLMDSLYTLDTESVVREAQIR